MRYLLDEHIDPVLRRALLRADPALEVWMIGDPGAPSRGTLDPDILIWCEMNGFCLVTNNRKSMPRHLADHLALGQHMPGIFVVNLALSMGHLTDELVLIAGVAADDEFRDLIVYLPLS
ncbi:DUF5615 family PIN-like protein [Candidatus Chloroploca sp. Khr17]|uniref:DUF5615 family PIN-like protein n=1 Tax=Candidatus Chloroploca sp. Khr17 TaxID=2496869 RepID=UPI00196A8412|nr:DUF5615 family PIN-like protein [Candidatus Chloroploca sp. Khr17]